MRERNFSIEYGSSIFEIYILGNKISNPFEWVNHHSLLEKSDSQVICQGLMQEYKIEENEPFKFYQLSKEFLIKYTNGTKNKIEAVMAILLPRVMIVEDESQRKYKLWISGMRKTYKFNFLERKDFNKWFAAFRSIGVLCDFYDYYRLLNKKKNSKINQIEIVEDNEKGEKYFMKSYFIPRIIQKIDKINSLVNEIVCLRKINHPHVIRLWDIFETHLHIHLIFEYAYENSLSFVMKKYYFEDEEIYRFMYHFICTIKHFHDKKIVHRNLNPDHILIFDKNFIENFKICGFGCSTFNNISSPFKIKSGGEIFSAPEVNLNENCGPNIDTYSIGKILEFLIYRGKININLKNDNTPKYNIINESKSDFQEKTKKNILKNKLQKMIFEFTNPNKEQRPIPSLINLKVWFNNIEESESILYRELIDKHQIDTKAIESLKGVVPEKAINKNIYMTNNFDQINNKDLKIPSISNLNSELFKSSYNNIEERKSKNLNSNYFTPLSSYFSNNKINFSDFLDDIDGRKSPLKEYVFKFDDPVNNPRALNFDKESIIPNEDLDNRNLNFLFAESGASRGLLVNSNHFTKQELK